MISVEAKQRAELSSRRCTNAAVGASHQMGKGNTRSPVLSNPCGCGKRLERTEEVEEKEQRVDKSNLMFTSPPVSVFCTWDQCLSEPGYYDPQLRYVGCYWPFLPQCVKKELRIILKHNDLKSGLLALGRKAADCQILSAFNEPGEIFLRGMLTQTDLFTESKGQRTGSDQPWCSWVRVVRWCCSDIYSSVGNLAPPAATKEGK